MISLCILIDDVSCKSVEYLKENARKQRKLARMKQKVKTTSNRQGNISSINTNLGLESLLISSKSPNNLSKLLKMIKHSGIDYVDRMINKYNLEMKHSLKKQEMCDKEGSENPHLHSYNAFEATNDEDSNQLAISVSVDEEEVSSCNILILCLILMLHI